MPKTIVVGLTGGIGSGKTTCSKVFDLLGVPVYYTDDRAKALYDEDSELKKSVLNLMGEGAYKNGKFDRSYVGSKVFETPSLLQQLEQLVHPRVKVDFETWVERLAKATPYVLREAAILIESGSHKDCDAIICVSASAEERIKRVMKRDQVDRETVIKRMSYQLDDSTRERYADHLIHTDQDALVIPQIEEIHKLLLGA